MLSVPCSGCCTASHPRRSSPQCLVLSHSHISLRSSQASACDYTPLPMIQATLDCPVAHSENHLEALGSSMLLCRRHPQSAPLSISRSVSRPASSSPPILSEMGSAIDRCLVPVFRRSYISRSYRHYQKYHQPNVGKHYLAISKRFTGDGAERHVVLLPPIPKFLLHDF